MRIHTKSTIVLVLLLSGIVMTALSASLFIRIDQIVHGDLYRFGLQFDYEWAREYWTNARLMLILLAAAMIVTGTATALFQFSAQTGKIAHARLANSLSLAAGIAMIALSTFVFNKIDLLVHNDLYRYGLQFSYEWAEQYWIYARSMLGLLGLAIATSAASMVLVLKGTGMAKPRLFTAAHTLPQVDRAKTITLVLLSAGIIALAFSINFSLSVLALVGLGLVFWSAILLYIRPEKYVKESLFAKATSSSLVGLDEILRELGYKSKGIYLPPQYLEASESSKVYMSTRSDSPLPSSEQIQSQKDRVFLNNPWSILITPPGAELSKLFEEKLRTSFTAVDLQYLEQRLPSLLTEELQIADNFEITGENGCVHVRIESSVCGDMHREAEALSLSHIYDSLGCPLCSAIATALAKTTGKPVIIEKELISEDGKTFEIEYRLLEQPKEKT